ncbi:8-amino-7-oxononanoate synthase [Aurantivibrio plasticivorans]
MTQSQILRNRVKSTLAERKAQRLYRARKVLTSPQGSNVQVDGRQLINFCSNDYLGLANDPRVIQALTQGAARWGVGSGASHLICGHSSPHHQLEEALAEFTGREAALLFSSGYSANMAAINGLVSIGDQVYQDRLNHASLLDGGWISRADCHWFEHADMASLDEQLSVRQVAQPQPQSQALSLVVSDGVFSMDGDVCPTQGLADVAANHGAVLMIDDAHGIGCTGNQGTGTIDPSRFSSAEVPILMGTLGKAFGTAGAFIAGDAELIDYLIQKARNYIYSTAMPAAIAYASLTSLELVKHEAWRRENLSELIGYFRECAAAASIPLGDSNTAIQPIMIGKAETALLLSDYLSELGLWVSAIRPPTVPQHTSRLRITITASHTRKHIEQLVEVLARGLQKLMNADQRLSAHG